MQYCGGKGTAKLQLLQRVIYRMLTALAEGGIILHHVHVGLERAALRIQAGTLLVAGDGAVAAYDDVVELVVILQVVVVEVGEAEERRERHVVAMFVDVVVVGTVVDKEFLAVRPQKFVGWICWHPVIEHPRLSPDCLYLRSKCVNSLKILVC